MGDYGKDIFLDDSINNEIGTSFREDSRMNSGYQASRGESGYDLGRAIGSRYETSHSSSRYEDLRYNPDDYNKDASRQKRDYGRDYERDHGRDYGRDYERDYGRGRERDRDRGRDYGSGRKSEYRRSQSREHHRERDRHHDRERHYERERGRSRERSPYDRHHYRDKHQSHRHRRDDSPIINFDRYATEALSPYRGVVLPLEDRQRVLKNWDAAPPGFERITADKAKLTGLFPPPGNIAKITNFVPPTLDPTKAALLAMLTNPSATNPSALTDGLGEGGGAAAMFAPALAKQARRVYVGGIPTTCHEEDIAEFFNERMNALAPSGSTYVLGVEISGDRDYAFVDFRSSEEADLACTLHDSVFQGRPLVVRRTREMAFNPSMTTPETQSEPIEEYQVVITGLCSSLKEGHLKFLLGPWGGCKYVRVLTTEETEDNNGVFGGIAVVEMEDRSVVDPLIEGMRDFQVGEWNWQVCKLPDCIDNPDLARILSQHSLTPGKATTDPTPVMQLLNLITWDDLVQSKADNVGGEDEEYQSLLEDVREECSQFGKVVNVVIPRPSSEGRVAGIGKVYVEFSTIEECMQAVKELAGRTFAERTVLTSYYPTEKYQRGIF